MTNEKYSKAYKEVFEILKYVPSESVEKIPKEMLNMFKEEQSKYYEFKIDTEKPFEEQELLDETKAILANIFRDYWATEDQKKAILEKEKFDREELERAKREKYNPDDIFKDKNSFQEIEIKEKQNQLLIDIKKESVFQRLLNFIKNFLCI